MEHLQDFPVYQGNNCRLRPIPIMDMPFRIRKYWCVIISNTHYLYSLANYLNFLFAGLLVTDCYRYNYDSPGANLKIQKEVKSVEECQKICQETPQCESFAYGESLQSEFVTRWPGWCFLKNANIKPIMHIGMVLGPKHCRKLSS